MSSHKYIDRICLAAALLSLLAALVLFGSGAAGSGETVMGYEARLFDTGRVHTIDIVMDDWDAFLETCENEEYAACSVVIDGEGYKNIGIRAKGNTSLSMVSSLDSSRYSFKLEFDQYDTGRTYYGLDKLCLNNLIQDNTCMKDYLVYQMMNACGVDAPLCSYVYITVNGEDWGLYLAVEGVEEGFLQRTGNSRGTLYKPDSLSMGGGRGNGREFNMEDLNLDEDGFPGFEDFRTGAGNQPAGPANETVPERPASENGQTQPDTSASGADSQPSSERANIVGEDQTDSAENRPESETGGENRTDTPENRPENETGGGNQTDMPENRPENESGVENQEGTPENGTDSQSNGGRSDFTEGRPGGMGGGPGGMGGMGAADVKLQYIDDDPESYANIFGSAKTDVSDADQARLISALKALGENDVSALDTDQVLRYFVVHNYVCNGDSYTGNLVHNYYLYEEEGRLSMIPWDYNLAFGGFQTGNASATVNDPIDTPQSVTGGGDRPMIDWIFSDPAYTEQYHQYFAAFLESVDPAAIIAEASELIAPYVEKDPTKFCTYEEYQTAVQTLTEFCRLRTESVRGQLAGEIPTTSDGQNAEPETLVDTAELNLSDMGSMNQRGDFGGGFPGNRGQQNGAPTAASDAAASPPDQPDAAPTGGETGDRIPDRVPPDGSPETMAFPDGPPGFTGSPGEEASAGPEAFILLGASVLILLAGFLLLKRYRRWGI